MSEEQLRKLISESLKIGGSLEEDNFSSEDQFRDTSEFEDEEGLGDYDEVPMAAIDMPIQDKGVFSAMSAGENEEDFSDLGQFRDDGDSLEGNFQDDVSVSPGYFNENEVEDLTIDTIPLASVDMPIQDKGVFSAMGDEEIEDDLSDVIKYGSDGDDYENFQDDVSVSPGYFNENKVVKLTISELKTVIKEGVAKLHKKTLIENRIEQINNELNSLNNPENWKNTREEAKIQQRKHNLAWSNLTPKK